MYKTKEQMIAEYQAIELKVGELVIPDKSVNTQVKYNSRFTIDSINDNGTFTISDKNISYGRLNLLVTREQISRPTFNIGYNPFEGIRISRAQNINYNLDSIVFCLELREKRRAEPYRNESTNTPINEVNWNPFILDDNNNPIYYQRDLCWSLKDKQLLIESIINGIECGKVVVKRNNWDFIDKCHTIGLTECSFTDIVDGKQRLNSIKEFLNDEFPDLRGIYYRDYSKLAQHKLLDNQLISFFELPEDTTNEEILDTFLAVNFTGVRMSEEHINFVKSLREKL